MMKKLKQSKRGSFISTIKRRWLTLALFLSGTKVKFNNLTNNSYLGVYKLVSYIKLRILAIYRRLWANIKLYATFKFAGNLLIFLAILYWVYSPVLDWLTEEMQGLNVSCSSFISCYSIFFSIIFEYIWMIEYSKIAFFEIFRNLCVMVILFLNSYYRMNKDICLANVCLWLGPNNVLTKQIKNLYTRDPVSKGKYGKQGAMFLKGSITFIPVGFTASALAGLSLVYVCISGEYNDINFKSLDCLSQLRVVQKRWDSIADYTSSNSEFYNEVLSHHIKNGTTKSEKCINALIEGDKYFNSKEYLNMLEYEKKYKKHILRYHRDSGIYNEFSYINGPDGPKRIMSTKDFNINLNQDKKDWNKLYKQLAQKKSS